MGTGSSLATNSFGRSTNDSTDEIIRARNNEIGPYFIRLHHSRRCLGLTG